ncbi:rhomboid family intramembrane serine protease [Halorussus salilacus]|uniref:rhomboid family intramembrane serine protease n=1 Tax=Halorussus salilacus TaxID=2953750 RepID=UPI0020A1AD60|nr:rhomboid family intramembrane serine protease [Halorussus salilacus]USZ69355.1 rhomboid family intramembrane serine protease [Halorussus salilacus]
MQGPPRRSESARSPTLETLVVFVAVFGAQSLVGLVSQSLATGLFVLAPPVEARPWTLLVSVYAHASVGHLVSNAAVLVLVGFAVERVTTRWRFHAFFATVGMAAGLAQVVVSGVVGPANAVLGASGAVFGLLGYLLAGNAVTGAVLRRLPLGERGRLALLVAFALGVTLLTARPGVALVAHFTGFVLGGLAGRAHLLRTGVET